MSDLLCYVETELAWKNDRIKLCNIFDRTTFYIKEKMMEEGIPFVIEGKQVFLPFIGYLLSKENERELAPVYLISFFDAKNASDGYL